MSAPRRFDHDAARAEHAAGAKLREIAERHGVTISAVRRVVNPAVSARQTATGRRWRTTTCEDCGGPAMRLVGGKSLHNPDGRVLCHACRGKVRRTRFRFDEHGNLTHVRCSILNCANGERWQTPDRFAAGTHYRDLRPNGIHSQCTACQTRSRTAYRLRGRVPCENNCGNLTEGAGRPTRAGKDPNRPYICRTCWAESQRKAAR